MALDSENWVTQMIALYTEGRHDTEVRRELGITKRQWDSYMTRSREFVELVEWGRELAEAWHYEQSRVNLQNKEFNTTLYKTRMSNIYGWADKVDNRNANANLQMDAEQLRKELGDRLPEVLRLIGKDEAAALLEHKPDE